MTNTSRETSDRLSKRPETNGYKRSDVDALINMNLKILGHPADDGNEMTQKQCIAHQECPDAGTRSGYGHQAVYGKKHYDTKAP